MKFVEGEMSNLKAYMVFGYDCEYIIGYAFAYNPFSAKRLGLFSGDGYSDENLKTVLAFRCRVLDTHYSMFFNHDIPEEGFISVDNEDNIKKLCFLKLSKYCEDKSSYIFCRNEI